jgi:uncharacterized protein (TIGR00369 family)
MRRFPLGELLGFEYHETPEGYEIEFQPRPEHLNPRGALHGGVLCDLTDSAMGLTWMKRVGEDQSFATVELKINFLKPVWDSRLRAIPRILKGGRTVALLACEVFDPEGSLVAYATSTVMMLHGESAKGR